MTSRFSTSRGSFYRGFPFASPMWIERYLHQKVIPMINQIPHVANPGCLDQIVICTRPPNYAPYNASVRRNVSKDAILGITPFLTAVDTNLRSQTVNLSPIHKAKSTGQKSPQVQQDMTFIPCKPMLFTTTRRSCSCLFLLLFLIRSSSIKLLFNLKLNLFRTFCFALKISASLIMR
jgi:hypothetical protein